MSSQYVFFPYNILSSYKQNDVVYDGAYHYATQDIPNGSYNPSGFYSYSISATTREDDIATITYTHTGGLPFAAGSCVSIFGTTSESYTYTGMVLRGGSGTFQFVSAGLPQTVSVGGGTVVCNSPGWTTGFMWIPTYTTKIGTQNNTLVTQLGDGYSQRSPNGINTFNQTMNLVYQNVGKRQARAMQNFIEDHAGASSFEVLLGDPFLNNQPNQKWIAASADVTPVSFELYDCQIPVARVFDI